MAKVGRNDPCPCGSGKKYKKCCVNKALGPRKVTHQASNLMNRMSGFTQALDTPSLSGRIKSLSERVSADGKGPNIAASDVLKQEED